ncbi:hypothetical protein BBK82_10635 [Lentzea guizhouensis]|uniref:Uncharacterized protein n=1 Tax=Lentzea guizhouensis TaxID=1586287 RepID=A0A1B2HFG7_9PSEU|nr:hypothetical protein [Lentzea guizhouensis]ANZ36453.1 hypothetical protein BBK82_10635 [Lentzea guizhouensis]
MLGDLAAEIASHLIGLPLDYGTTVEQIAALLVAEPRNRAAVCAVVAVVVDDALADPFRETTSNRWRTRIPAWVAPQMIGVTVRRMLTLDVLVHTGRYVRSTDKHGRNTGKLMALYALNLAAPALLQTRTTAEQPAA